MISNIESLVTMNYVKYKRLTEIVSDAYKDSTADILNFYIDINTIIKPLFSKSGVMHYDIEDPNALCAAIVNMCAHYRSFFKNYQVTTKFYLVFSWNHPEHNNTFVKGYNKGFIDSVISNKSMMNYVLGNMDRLETISPYLPNIEFHKTIFETSAYIYQLIKLNNQKQISYNTADETNIILTKDILNLQNVARFPHNTSLMRPLKYEGDGSYIVYIKDQNQPLLFWNMYCKEMKIKPFEFESYILNPVYISPLIAISNFKQRNIYSMFPYRRALQYCIDYDKCMLSSNLDPIVGPKTFADFIMSNVGSDAANPFTIENNIKAIDVTYQNIIFENSMESRIIGNVSNNLYDKTGIHEINERYFKKCPLYLDDL